MEQPVDERNGNARRIIARVSRDARLIAVASGIVGLLIYAGGWVWYAFLSGPATVTYPAGCAAVAGIFVGAAVDLGIVVGVVGLLLEATAKVPHPSVRADENREDALVSVTPD